MPVHFGFLLFPNLTQLDLNGPYEVFSHVPDGQLHLIWKDLQPVRSDKGMQILPNTTLEICPQLDVICVPGGIGQMDLMEDEEVLSFLRRQAEGAQYITSVCTGSLLLGAAGLLDGYKATTHWAMTDLLSAYGAIHAKDRVVRDRNRITGAGVSAGIDFALTLVAELYGEDMTKMIQLGIEYDPHPPFTSGHPDVAEPHITERMRALMSATFDKRQEQTKT